jgi:hypothetical protein
MCKQFNRSLQGNEERPPSLHPDSLNDPILLCNSKKAKKMDFFKTNFKAALFLTVLTVILSLGANFVFRSCSMQSEAASRDYVDTQDDGVLNYVDKQDGIITERVDRVQRGLNDKADKDDFDKLYLKTEENNKLLIDILREVKR